MKNVDDLLTELETMVVDFKYSDLLIGRTIVYQENDDDEVEVFKCVDVNDACYLIDETGEGYPPENCWIL